MIAILKAIAKAIHSFVSLNASASTCKQLARLLDGASRLAS
jgi:hypothetical protein